MAKLIKYLVVDVNNGKWIWNKDQEHHSIATPKMLNNLELRINHLLKSVKKKISKGMMTSVHNRNSLTDKLYEKIYHTKEELNLHIFMLTDFRRKVEENLKIENEGSPLMKMKKMDSPLSRKNKTSISHIYERLDNSEIISRLDKAQKNLDSKMETLDIMKKSWEEILDLTDEIDSTNLLFNMQKIRKNLNIIDEEYQEIFFISDDVTRGLLKKGIHLKVVLSDVLNKLVDLLLRSLLQISLNYRKSKKRVIVEKILLRLKELELYNISDMNVQVLLDVKILLEIEPINIPSYETCYKKIGELHSNIHNKMFILKSLNYLREYFPEELNFTIDSTTHELEKIHKQLILKDDEGKELEIYIKVIEDLMMQSNPGKEYFSLNNKLHKNHMLISSKYHILNQKDLIQCLTLIGSDSFRNLITYCENCIFDLRKELKRNQIVNLENIMKIGMATGKTTMIDTYHKAIDEILASLGTFIANTIHVLIREMLMNIPKDEILLRLGLESTYKRSESALRELDSFSDSY